MLPLAATEQHGPHLPVGTDVMIAEAYLERVRELFLRNLPVTFLPLQPVGISTEHLDYPGTLTLPTDVALKTWMALGESVARAGVKKLVMVTSHGGNSAAMTLVAQDLRARHGLFVVTTSWSRFGAPNGLFPTRRIASRHSRWRRGNIDHAGAIWPARAPRCDRRFPLERDRDGESLSLVSAHRPAPFAWQAQDLHGSGAVGDATLASAEKGEQLIEHGARAFCELLEDVDKFDLKALSARPKS